VKAIKPMKAPSSLDFLFQVLVFSDIPLVLGANVEDVQDGQGIQRGQGTKKASPTVWEWNHPTATIWG